MASRSEAEASHLHGMKLRPLGRRFFTCARHGHRYRGESPPQVHMAETASRTARASIARWGLKEAAGKATIRGTRTAKEAEKRPARRLRRRGDAATFPAGPTPRLRESGGYGAANDGGRDGTRPRRNDRDGGGGPERKPRTGIEQILCRTTASRPLRIRKLNGQVDSNRRIRTRMSGGVGGRRP